MGHLRSTGRRTALPAADGEIENPSLTYNVIILAPVPASMLNVRDFLDDQSVLASPDAPASPAVSVILPTYKRCLTGQLERAIRSVLAQRFTDFELLVMDDGSSDGSSELIESLRRLDPRVI